MMDEMKKLVQHLLQERNSQESGGLDNKMLIADTSKQKTKQTRMRKNQRISETSTESERENKKKGGEGG